MMDGQPVQWACPVRLQPEVIVRGKHLGRNRSESGEGCRFRPTLIDMRRAQHNRARWSVLTFCLALTCILTPIARATSNATDDTNTEPRSGEYRVTLFPYHKISDTWTGFGYVGYVWNPDKQYHTDYLGWGANYAVSPTVQIWGGLIGTYTDNATNADKFELRPFVGVKNFFNNNYKWNIYNFARLEYREIQDRDTRDWTGYSRFRDRIGVEFPLTSADLAWKPKTWYGLADAEAFFRFDKDYVDPCRLRAGVGYIVSNRVRVELIYHLQWTRPNGGPLTYTDNIIRLNIKIALNRGVLQRVFDGGGADD
jgi:Protein of unknown function (DUF2490)